MNKKNYFNGLNAKLALAAVALTSVMLTSCDKENFTVDPTEPTKLADASAIIGATAYDYETGSALNATFTPASSYSVPAKDGVIAETSVAFTAAYTGYYTQSRNIAVPAVAKGQMIFIPAVFYMSETEADYTWPIVPDDAPETSLTDEASIQSISNFKKGETNDIPVTFFQGFRIKDLEATLAKIDALKYEDGVTRASEDEIMVNVKEALKNQANKLSEFDTYTTTVPFFVPEDTKTISVEVTPVVKDGTISLSTMVGNTEWTVKDIEVEVVAYNNYAIMTTNESGHSHTHGHGNSNNAGGGIVGK